MICCNTALCDYTIPNYNYYNILPRAHGCARTSAASPASACPEAPAAESVDAAKPWPEEQEAGGTMCYHDQYFELLV